MDRIMDTERAAVLLEALELFLEASAKIVKARALRPVEARLEKSMMRIFAQQETVFLREMKKHQSSFPVEESISNRDLDRIMAIVAAETAKDMETAILGATGIAMQAGATEGITAIGVDISFDLKNPRAVKFLTKNAAEKVTGIDDTTKLRMRTILTQATDEGWSYNRTAEEIKDRWEEFRVGKPQQHIESRAHLVAVTESANAYEAGNKIVIDEMTAVGLEMEKRWLDSGDDLVSDECAANSAEGWIPASQTHRSGDMHPPRFPGCLPGDQIVAAQGILGATKRFFDGELVIVQTARGNEFSCTPNHPILTPRGWIGAGFLNEGDEIICSRETERMAGHPSVYYEHMPASIEEIVHSFGLSRKLVPHPVKVSAPDFHGDGKGSDITVVWADSSLRDGVDTSKGQDPLNSPLVLPDVARFGFTGESHLTSLLMRVLPPTSCIMGSLRIAGVFLMGTFRHHEAVCLKAIARFYARFKQPLSYRAPIHIKTLGQGVLRLPSFVLSDNVVDIRRRQFIGHVYNLQTLSEYYTTSTVIMHNCRCDELYRRKAGGA